MYCNDKIGCCVIAEAYHYAGVVTGNARGGNPSLVTDDRIIADYSAITGYVPGDSSTDRGTNVAAALNYYKTTGLATGWKLTGFAPVDGRNQTLIKQAIHLFENLNIAMCLPDEWLNAQAPRGNGFVWDVAGPHDPQNGHDIMAYGYDSNGLSISTWGMKGTMTWAAVAAYLNPAAQAELYTRLSPANLLVSKPGVAPNGYDWWSLVDFINALGAGIPRPIEPSSRVITFDLGNRAAKFPHGMKVIHNHGGSLVISPTANAASIPLNWTYS